MWRSLAWDVSQILSNNAESFAELRIKRRGSKTDVSQILSADVERLEEVGMRRPGR